MQITILNPSGDRVNYYPACNYWKYCSVVCSCLFPRGNYLSVTWCRLKSPTLCLWEQQSYPGTTRESIEDNHIKRRPCPSSHVEAEEVSLSCPESVWSWSGELDAMSLSAWPRWLNLHLGYGWVIVFDSPTRMVLPINALNSMVI